MAIEEGKSAPLFTLKDQDGNNTWPDDEVQPW